MQPSNLQCWSEQRQGGTTAHLLPVSPRMSQPPGLSPYGSSLLSLHLFMEVEGRGAVDFFPPLLFHRILILATQGEPCGRAKQMTQRPPEPPCGQDVLLLQPLTRREGSADTLAQGKTYNSAQARCPPLWHRAGMPPGTCAACTVKLPVFQPGLAKPGPQTLASATPGSL